MSVRTTLLAGFDRARAVVEYAGLRVSPYLLGGLLDRADPVARHEAILAVPEAGIVEPQKYTAQVLRSQQFLIEQGGFRGVRTVRDFHERSIRADRKPDLRGTLTATVRRVLESSTLDRARLRTDMEYLYQRLWNIERSFGARTAMYFGVLCAVRDPMDSRFNHTAMFYAERLDNIFRRTEHRLAQEEAPLKPRSNEDLDEIHRAIFDKRHELYQEDSWDPLTAIDAVYEYKAGFNCVSLAFVDAMSYLQLGIPAGILKVPEEEHSLLALRLPFQKSLLYLESTSDEPVGFNRPYGEGAAMNYLGFVSAMSTLRIFEESKAGKIDLGEAIVQLEQLKVLTPHLPELYTAIGMSLLAASRPLFTPVMGEVSMRAAYHNFQTALRLSRTYRFTSYQGLAHYYQIKGAFTSAAKYYEKVLDDAPKNFQAHMGLTLIVLRMGDIELACNLLIDILKRIENMAINAKEEERTTAELMLAAVIEKFNAETSDEEIRRENQQILEELVRRETLEGLKQRGN